jgi:hypothetical protein
VVAQALSEETPHEVSSTADAELALAALWLAPEPLVALIDERLAPFGALGILAIAANDGLDGPLARHRYVLMSTVPYNLCPTEWAPLARLHTQVLSLPFELDTLLQVVEDAARGLTSGTPARQIEAQPEVSCVAAFHKYLAPGVRASM